MPSPSLRTSTIAIVGSLSFLVGCEPKQTLFETRDGAWYYNGTPIEGIDATTFEVVAEHYARDRSQVVFLDTYRSSQDYFTTRRSRIFVVKGADPASFRYLDEGYAKDSAHVFHDGVAFPVKDVKSFQLLGHGFARDDVTGYYHQTVVPGSAGRTFAVVDHHYSKDSVHVYYSDLVSDDGTKPPYARSVRVPGADPATIASMDGGYAVDAKRAYYRGEVLTSDVAAFRTLSLGYARSGAEVFYEGTPIPGADAATFAVLERPGDGADARDARARYLQGRRTDGTPPPEGARR
jgi:hypothetical protein